MESLHLGVHILRPADEVYNYASQRVNLAAWASGVNDSMQIEFAEQNAFGVLDHWATVEGVRYYNPMRVIPDGDGAELVFTLRRLPGTSDDDFANDAAAIAHDLARLKELLEAR